MGVTKTQKLDYKLKEASFVAGQLVNENGELINIIDDLQKVFNTTTFSLTASVTSKEEYEVSDFAE